MGNRHEREFKKHQEGFAGLAKALKDQSLYSHVMASTGYLLAIFGLETLFPKSFRWLAIVLESREFLLFAMVLLIIALTWFFSRAKLVKDYATKAAVCLQDYEALLNSQDALAKENDRLITKEFILDKFLLSNGINPKEVNFNGSKQLENNQNN